MKQIKEDVLKEKDEQIDSIIDDFLDSPYFNEIWEQQYATLRKRLKEDLSKLKAL